MVSTPAVWKQYNKMAVLHFFLVNSTLIYIVFSLQLKDYNYDKKNQLSNGCNQYKWLNNGPKTDFEMLPALQTAKCKFVRLCYHIDPLHNGILSCYKWFVFSTRSYKWKRVRCNFRFGFEGIIQEIVIILVHREIF